MGMKIHPICALPLAVCLVLTVRAQAEENLLAHAVVPAKELLVIDPAVVDSPLAEYPGALSIGYLFDQLAADGDGATMMREWLETWTRDLNINGAEVPARSAMLEKIIRPWQAADGFDAETGDEWLPDLGNAPFRLLAVVNRMDLVSLAPVYYGGVLVNAKAEGRLVYAAIDREGKPLDHHFTVIFEYNQPDGQGEVVELAKGWRRLGAMPDFDQCYLDGLESLTRAFTDKVFDKKSGGWKPPTIAQVRTNDMALDEECEMREFRLNEKRNVLAPAVLANTPSMAFARKGSRLNRVLANFLNENAEGAKDGASSSRATLRIRPAGRCRCWSGLRPCRTSGSIGIPSVSPIPRCGTTSRCAPATAATRATRIPSSVTSARGWQARPRRSPISCASTGGRCGFLIRQSAGARWSRAR